MYWHRRHGTTSPSYTLHVNGSVAGTSACNNISDERLKKDIATLANALARVEKLRGVTFDRRREEHQDMKLGKRPEMGVIAQEVVRVFPAAVTKDDNGLFSVAYSMLIAPLIEAVKELHAQFLEKTGQHDRQLGQHGR